jgi:hypothetical protein
MGQSQNPVTEVAAMTAETAMASEAAVTSAVTSEAAAVPTTPAVLRCRRPDVAQHADAHQKSRNGGPLHAFSDLPEFSNEVQHQIRVLRWTDDMPSYRWKTAVRLPHFTPRGARSGKSHQLWIARHRLYPGS